MNVKQLKKELEYWDDDMDVYFSYDYGDHAHHIVVEEIEFVGAVKVRESSYTGTLVMDGEAEEAVLVLGDSSYFN